MDCHGALRASHAVLTFVGEADTAPRSDVFFGGGDPLRHATAVHSVRLCLVEHDIKRSHWSCKRFSAINSSLAILMA